MAEFDNDNNTNKLDKQGQDIQQPHESQTSQEQAFNNEIKEVDYAQMQEQASQKPQPQAQQQYQQPEPQKPQPQARQQYQQAEPQQPQQPQYQYQQPHPQQYQQAQQPKSNGLAIASLVLGIISIIFLCLPVLPVLTAIIGLILGIINLVKGNDGKGMAIAGVILSGISLIFGVLLIIGLASFFTNESFMNELMDQIQYNFDNNMWDSY